MSVATTLNDQTAAAVRQALEAANRGQFAEACKIGEQALAAGGEAIALNAMLGMLRCQMGQVEAGAGHLRIAHEGRAADLKIATNLVTALAQLEQFEEALGILTAEMAASDKTLRLLKLRGFVAQNAGEFAVAVAAYEQAVAADPKDWESWNNLGNARRGAGDAQQAVDALRRAVELRPDAAPVRLNYATALEFAGNVEDAEREYRGIGKDFPNNAEPFQELFQLLRMQYRDDDALDAIEEAVRRAPADIALGLGLASHRLNRLKHAAAEEAYRRILNYEPNNTLGWLGIATVLDQTNRTDELAALVGEAERAKVGADGLSFIKAFDHRRARRHSEGLEELRKVPEDLETARRQQLLGQLLEGVGEYDAAIAAFDRMNQFTDGDPASPELRAASYREMVQQNRETLTRAWVDSWREAKPDDRPSPAFLVGFPRSGTTLLDTILMGHPGTEVLEEEPTLMNAAERLGGFAEIPAALKLKEARDTYFETARALSPLEPGKLLIDKNPLAMNSIPMIRRLFPDARIILALRHPCDVVLSCFVTNFKPNNSTVNFKWLDKAAELYDLSFSYFEQACELLNPPVHRINYENIVSDRERELRPLFDFLELPWSEQVLDHQSTARSRGHIKTASYAQVVEPIYQRSAGRWQSYRKHLEPVFPILRPWVEKFGYSLDPIDPAPKGQA